MASRAFYPSCTGTRPRGDRGSSGVDPLNQRRHRDRRARPGHHEPARPPAFHPASAAGFPPCRRCPGASAGSGPPGRRPGRARHGAPRPPGAPAVPPRPARSTLRARGLRTARSSGPTRRSPPVPRQIRPAAARHACPALRARSAAARPPRPALRPGRARGRWRGVPPPGRPASPEPLGRRRARASARSAGVALLVIACGVGGAVWYGTHTAPASANVGDCVAQTGSDSLAKVSCTDKGAQFRVDGRLENRRWSTRAWTWSAPSRRPPVPTGRGESGEPGLVLLSSRSSRCPPPSDLSEPGAVLRVPVGRERRRPSATRRARPPAARPARRSSPGACEEQQGRAPPPGAAGPRRRRSARTVTALGPPRSRTRPPRSR